MRKTVVGFVASMLLVASAAVAGTGALTGTVIDDQGQPVEGARVSLWVADQCVGYVLSNTGGMFLFDAVDEGTYTVRAGMMRVGKAQIDGVIVIADQTTDVGPITLIGAGPRPGTNPRPRSQQID